MHHDLTLHGPGVTLVPLEREHASALLALVDDELWSGMTTPTPRTVDDATRWVTNAQADAGRLAFAVLGDDGEVRGSTSFHDVEHRVGRCEIGSTFYGRAWWGGRTNPACKLTMLTHAFETWGMHRVALRADARNTRSLAAIERIGAVHEGTLRGHRIAADGTRGDTVYYSILGDEWPAARAALAARLSAPPSLNSNF